MGMCCDNVKPAKYSHSDLKSPNIVCSQLKTKEKAQRDKDKNVEENNYRKSTEF